MDLRKFLPLAPLMFRPVLSMILDWMDLTDKRLAALEEQRKP
jgi:hypothetical protein